jgi:hypothetical protein
MGPAIRAVSRLHDAGNIGMQRRKIWGVMLDEGLDSRAIAKHAAQPNPRSGPEYHPCDTHHDNGRYNQQALDIAGDHREVDVGIFGFVQETTPSRKWLKDAWRGGKALVGTCRDLNYRVVLPRFAAGPKARSWTSS